MVWCFHLFKNFPQFVVIYTVKGFGIINKAEAYVFQEFSCFFYDSTDVGNLISGSSAFCKPSLNVWTFSVHILLMPRLENFEPGCYFMFSSSCCFLTCIQVSQDAGQVVWYSHPFKNFPQLVVIHTVKGLGIVNIAEIDVFLELLLFR